MRESIVSLAAPEILTNLPAYTYRNMWNASLPKSDLLPVDDLVDWLKDVSRYYDHISLQTEKTSQSEARATISFDKNIANLGGIPALEVSMPLSEHDLDYCFEIFIKFLNWPEPKEYAWLEINNTNPLVEENDIRRVVAFFRSDLQILNFAVERMIKGIYHPDIDRSCITIAAFERIKRVCEII